LTVTPVPASAGATLILTFVAGIDLAQADPVRKTSAGPLQQSIARIQAGQLRVHLFQSTKPRPRVHRSARRVIYAGIGAFAGFVAGGYVGVKIEGNRCRCDEPGLTGFIIGAPIAMIVGGVIGDRLGR
jgi:hypothetical protein